MISSVIPSVFVVFDFDHFILPDFFFFEGSSVLQAPVLRFRFCVISRPY